MLCANNRHALGNALADFAAKWEDAARQQVPSQLPRPRAVSTANTVVAALLGRDYYLPSHSSPTKVYEKPSEAPSQGLQPFPEDLLPPLAAVLNAVCDLLPASGQFTLEKPPVRPLGGTTGSTAASTVGAQPTESGSSDAVLKDVSFAAAVVQELAELAVQSCASLECSGGETADARGKPTGVEGVWEAVGGIGSRLVHVYR